MGGGRSTLLPAPDDRLMKCIQQLELSNTDLAKVFALFGKHDTAQRACLSLATVYNMLSERKSVFGDSVFELIGELALGRRWSKVRSAGRMDFEVCTRF